MYSHRLSLRPQTDLHQPAIRSLSLLFNGLHPCNPCNYMDYYSFTDPGGMESWVALVGWHIADTLPTKWSYDNHRSGENQIRESPPVKDGGPNQRATGSHYQKRHKCQSCISAWSVAELNCNQSDVNKHSWHPISRALAKKCFCTMCYTT